MFNRARLLTVILQQQQSPVLLDEQLEPSSPIAIATFSMSGRIMELHKDPNQLYTIDRRQFEEIIAEIFDGFGYSVELTARTRDGGKDIIAVGQKNQVRTKYLIECKRPEPGNPVGVGFARQLLGVVEDEKASKGLLVATTYFTPEARAFEQRNEWRLELKDAEHVLDWITQYVVIKNKAA